jgi:hypothetical protein
MGLSPREIRSQRPDIKYVFIRALDVSKKEGDRIALTTDVPIAKELFLDETPPPGYTLIKTVQIAMGDGSEVGRYARLYKVQPIVTPPSVGAQ